MASWPWVSRRAYDTVVAEVTAMRVALVAERARYDVLVEKMLDMKRQGFQPAELIRQAPPTDDLPAEVTDAILGRAGTLGNELAQQLYRYAQARMQAGAKPEEVAAVIWNGEGEDA